MFLVAAWTTGRSPPMTPYSTPTVRPVGLDLPVARHDPPAGEARAGLKIHPVIAIEGGGRLERGDAARDDLAGGGVEIVRLREGTVGRQGVLQPALLDERLGRRERLAVPPAEEPRLAHDIVSADATLSDGLRRQIVLDLVEGLAGLGITAGGPVQDRQPRVPQSHHMGCRGGLQVAAAGGDGGRHQENNALNATVASHE